MYLSRSHCTLLGLLVFAFGLAGVILYMSMSEAHCVAISPDNKGLCETALIINDVLESMILVGMTAACVWVYYCIHKLDVNPSPISLLGVFPNS